MTASGSTRDAQDRLRGLPSVDRLLMHPRAHAWLARYRRAYVTRHCRELLDEVRHAILEGADLDPAELGDDMLVSRLERRVALDAEPRLVRVVNATGTVLHTNLGRALLPPSVVDAISLAAAYPINVEFDLVQGGRGKREDIIADLLCELTGAEAASVVNNNAAGVLLALNTIAPGREVIVSRGELIEIGGAFRLPDIMAKSGALLREVGTTNRTHPSDYENAISEHTGLLLKAHPSNYRIVGFSSDVPLPTLVAIGRKHHVPVMEDLGSGALVDLGHYGLPKEPVVADRIGLGADVVTFSGDKVMGGPQAGLIVGRKNWLDRIATNPLHRALRCGKLTIAALEATLRLYRQSPAIEEVIPALRALARPIEELDAIGVRAVPALLEALGPGFRALLQDSTSQVGSGALPTEEIPTKSIVIWHDRLAASQIAERFRCACPPIIGRIKDDRFLLDLRTVFDPDDLVPKLTPQE